MADVIVSVHEGGGVKTVVIEPRLNSSITFWSVINVAVGVAVMVVFCTESFGSLEVG